MKKLEILVVEDTPENMEAAKQYFDSVEEIHAEYATNRNEAFSMIDSKRYDGVITDRSIPRCEGDKEDNTFYLQNQGFLVGLKSELENIPWVMHSEHGMSLYFAKDGNNPLNRGAGEKLFDIYSNPQSSNELKAERRKEGLGFLNNELRDQGMDIFSPQAYRIEGVTKKDAISWRLSLDMLKKRIQTYQK